MDASALQKWWRGRRWQCLNCKNEFALERPYRVTDMRGSIVEAWFWCPSCHRSNHLSKRKLDQYEEQAGRS